MHLRDLADKTRRGKKLELVLACDSMCLLFLRLPASMPAYIFKLKEDENQEIHSIWAY